LVDREQVFAGRCFDVFVDQIKLPGDRVVRRDVVHHPGAVAILAVLDPGRILLVRQDRPAIDDALWEIPAGTLEAGENPLDCAKRELLEETGYEAEDWTPLATFFTTPGICDEQMHMFRAEALRRVGTHDPKEITACQAFDRAELLQMVRTRKIRDAKTLIAYLEFDRLGPAGS